ncbi:hypothetical protein CK203_021443 [Vitis vinifera]|uniref:Uncharacterized protein n=1 Tax=Vitis vinifera TaxID=29760 RepID=A0A438ISB4_VITVI|nr:hypothetical protein CK203_021443 [Vitis vinifera]
MEVSLTCRNCAICFARDVKVAHGAVSEDDCLRAISKLKICMGGGRVLESDVKMCCLIQSS